MADTTEALNPSKPRGKVSGPNYTARESEMSISENTMNGIMTIGRFHSLHKREKDIDTYRWKLSNIKHRLKEELDEIELVERTMKHTGYWVGVTFQDGKPVSTKIFHEDDEMTDETMGQADVLIPLCKPEDYKEFDGF